MEKPKPVIVVNDDGSVSEGEQKFSLQDAIDWLERPENEARVREAGKRLEGEFKRGLSHVDDMVSGAAHIIKDCLESQEAAEELKDAILDSLFGGLTK